MGKKGVVGKDWLGVQRPDGPSAWERSIAEKCAAAVKALEAGKPD